MNQDEAFLAAIVENPGDDTPRLIYADFLLERDGPGDRERQEFIRVQCELARLEAVGFEHCKRLAADRTLDQTEPDGHERERIALRRREHELWELLDDAVVWRDLYAAGFCPELKEGDWQVNGALVRRGFAERVRCTAASWLAHGDKVRKAQPVTTVRLTTPIPQGAGWYVSLIDGVWRSPRFPGVAFSLPPESTANATNAHITFGSWTHLGPGVAEIGGDRMEFEDVTVRIEQADAPLDHRGAFREHLASISKRKPERGKRK